MARLAGLRLTFSLRIVRFEDRHIGTGRLAFVLNSGIRNTSIVM